MPSGAADPVVLFICEHGQPRASSRQPISRDWPRNGGATSVLSREGRVRTPGSLRRRPPDSARMASPPRERSREKLPSRDLKRAVRIVAFCELPEEYQNAARVERWTDVPPISENYQRSREAILQRIIALVEDLKAFQSRASELR